MTDQHTPRAMGVGGDRVAKTPHLDNLARSGVRFEHAYCADPICVPSRASLLTGLYPHNHQAYDNTRRWPFEPKTKLRAEEIVDPNSGSGLPQIDDLWRDHGDPWTGEIETDNRQGLVAVGKISPLAEEDHFESFVARESIRFLKNHGKQQPFFLISSFLKPHDPFMPV